MTYPSEYSLTHTHTHTHKKKEIEIYNMDEDILNEEGNKDRCNSRR